MNQPLGDQSNQIQTISGEQNEFATYGFSSNKYSQGLFITIPAMSETKEQAKATCKKHMAWLDEHLKTLSDRIVPKEMCGCVEEHTMPEQARSASHPWHAHIVIYFEDRVKRSANLWNVLCRPYYLNFQVGGQPIRVEWLINRANAYRYIAKENCPITFDRNHPLYFDATKLMAC